MKFKLEIQNSQAKYIISKNRVTQQSSYNLPNDFFEYIVGKNVVTSYENDNKQNDIYYKLSEDFRLILSDSIKSIIDKYDDNNSFICMKATSNGKAQLRRSDYNKNNSESYEWFVKLYDNNVVGNTIIFLIDEKIKTLTIDLKANNSKKSPEEIREDKEIKMQKKLDEFLTEEDLGKILTDLNNDPQIASNSAHIFGIEYGNYIENNNLDIAKILEKSEVKNSYHTEIRKGIRLMKLGVTTKDGMKPKIIKNNENYNRIIYGAPGTGKSYFLLKESQSSFDRKNIDRVTFYDGYTYGQFVGAYKPVPNGDSISYEYVSGPFMKQLIAAIKSPLENFCLIIEEINRARADKVFGNIFQLLDRTESGESQYPIDISEEQLEYIRKELKSKYENELNLIEEEGLYIPSNLHIWATMNSADQGVYVLDSAFKRRWNFEHIGLDENEDEFNENYKVKFDGKSVPWNEFRHLINNQLVEERVLEDRLIAPFYVSKEKDFTEENGTFILKDAILKDKILMYIFDDLLKYKGKSCIFDEKIKTFTQLKNSSDIFREGLFVTDTPATEDEKSD